MTNHKTKGKVRKLTPFSPQWEKEAGRIARRYCPSIYPCVDCGYPTIKGYCCTNCGSTNPEGAS